MAVSVRRRAHLPGGVRARASLVAAVVVTAALVGSAFVMVALTRSNLTKSLETVLASRVQDLASLAEAGGTLPTLPFVRGTSAQILDGEGSVIASTPDIEGQVALVNVTVPSGEVRLLRLPGLGGGDQQEQGEHADEEGPFLVAVGGVERGDELLQVVVAGSLAPVEGVVTALEPVLAVGIPLLVLVVAGMTWMLVGFSLRPVEEMITEAEGISLSKLNRRIPVPRSRDEIRHLADTLNNMLDRLEVSVNRQRRFISDASHELKSPVASILTMAEVAGSVPEDFDVGELAGDVAGEARRLALLVDDLLTLARFDERGLELKTARLDLVEVVSEAVDGTPSGAIQIDTTGLTEAFASVDRRRLTQVARNLLDNAVRHAESSVWVASGTSESSAWFVVADDGPGIPGAFRTEVFNRFVRLDDARARSEGGTGLGLAVVKAIVEAHGGTVRIVDDSRYSGAVFRVEIPTG